MNTIQAKAAIALTVTIIQMIKEKFMSLHRQNLLEAYNQRLISFDEMAILWGEYE